MAVFSNILSRFYPSLLWALAGCVSIKTHEDGVRDAYIRGLERARAIAHYQHCDEAVALINGRIDLEDLKK